MIANTEEWTSTDTLTGDECEEGEAASDVAWWGGCNACWCWPGGAACSRLWCGLPDCSRAVCAAGSVCVPAAGALCLRGPCAAPGECRRVAGRRVEAAPVPAPAACRPGQPPPPRCAVAALELARERLVAGAHAERACGALRRSLAAALAGDERAADLELVLLCDVAPDDDALLLFAMVNWARSFAFFRDMLYRLVVWRHLNIFF